jgi:ligand-binding sensor domain-containing protein
MGMTVPEPRGIVYFSFDNGFSWEDKSLGLPPDIFLTDLATGPNFLGASTKRNGIFLFDFQLKRWTPSPTVPVGDDDVDVLTYHNGSMIAGTGNSGLFISSNRGKSWQSLNVGLPNLTIRKIVVIDNLLYACTNGGLFLMDEATHRWNLVYGESTLQVNGVLQFRDELYIGTNRGAFKRVKGKNTWQEVLSKAALHNIGSDSSNVYAMVYNELYVSPDNGHVWKSDQKGMPQGKYTFQVIPYKKDVFAGQWDGVYRKTPMGWMLSNHGMPKDFPVTELVGSEGLLVAASSQWISK